MTDYSAESFMHEISHFIAHQSQKIEKTIKEALSAKDEYYKNLYQQSEKEWKQKINASQNLVSFEEEHDVFSSAIIKQNDEESTHQNRESPSSAIDYDDEESVF